MAVLQNGDEARQVYDYYRQKTFDSGREPIASVLRGAMEADKLDPSAKINGMPPNSGKFVIPHAISFQGIVSSIAKTYRASDEALKHSLENARFMLNDPIVQECVEQRLRSVCLLDWHLEPDDEQDSEQVQLAEALKSVIERTPRFMQYRENLAKAVWYGRSAVKHRWRHKRVRGQLRKAVEWEPLHGDKLVFRYDDGRGDHDPDQVGIRVGQGYKMGDMVNGRWKVEPTDYGLAYFLDKWERPLLAIHKHFTEDGEYEDLQNAGRIHGVGIRSRIYWAWFQKQETLSFLMEYLERSATGIELWYYPWGNDEAREQMRTAAQERIGQGRNIVLIPKPLGEEGMAYGVERIEPGMAGAETMYRIVTEYFGHMIKRYILGQTLTTEADATGLGSNLADVHVDTYMQIIRYDATNLEETLTTDLVDQVKLFNFPRYADIPVRFRIDTSAPDVSEKLEAWQKAWDMGLGLRAQDVRDLIGASKPDTDDEVLQNPQFQQQPGMGGGMPGMDPNAMAQQPQPSTANQFGMPKGGNADQLWRELEAQKDAAAVQQNLAAGPALENSERSKLATFSRDQS